MTIAYWPIKGNEGFQLAVEGSRELDRYPGRLTSNKRDVFLSFAYERGDVIKPVDRREEYLEKRLKHDGIV